MMNFDGKVVIVTGAAVGIGRAAAEAFSDRGAEVVIADIDPGAGEKAAREIGESATFARVDVSDGESIANMVEEVRDEFGRIDVLVNNAGIYQKGDVLDTSEEDWHRVLDVNLTGIYLCSRHVLAVMVEQGEGVVVNVASEAGIDAIGNQVAYNVSKAGAIMLTKSMAVDFADRGIRVNAVAPGTTFTPLVENALRKSDDPEASKRGVEECRPLNRLGRPEEIASAIVAMASGDLGYATGAVLSIDGGFTAQ